jgi:4'-phosphopantetheinyl transferase
VTAPLAIAPGGGAWLLQPAAEVPAGDDWLAPVERARLAQLHVAKRRADWRLGRWTAKRAIAAALAVAATRIAVIATQRGAPLALLDGVPAPVAISLSHAAGYGLCLVAPARAAVGCDLEPVEPRSAAFIRDYFTAAERALVGADARLATIVWCAKEAVLKAVGEGLREDPRTVAVTLTDEITDGWQRLAVAHAGRPYTAWARDLPPLVAVLAGAHGGT